MTLKGIRVIDFSQYIPGPYASLRLAELGADVINIEPMTGDRAREFDQLLGPFGVIYETHNYNKKSIAVDLKTEEGLNIIIDLIKEADVLLESFRPGVMQKLGLDYQRISNMNNKIIYVSLSGYGQEGPIANLGSHDLNYISLSGLLAQFKDQHGQPVLPSITLADLIGGIVASERILAALQQRGSNGIGQYIDLSLQDAIHSIMFMHTAIERRSGFGRGVPFLAGNIISYNVYRTKDGKYMSLAALEPKFWYNFCQGIDKEDWIKEHYSVAKEENTSYVELKELFLSKTQKEWIDFGLKVDCCLTPVLEISEIKNHPFFQFRTKKNTSTDKYSAPSLGENSDEVLKDILGKNEDEIEKLRKKNIIT